jgi:peptidoglycan/LPS O-acetylase OafA/YrhL
MARRRLDHVDAMRPVKQAGVISTHAILYFAPAAASAGSGAALLLLHVSREGFFFISACMLTYAYSDNAYGVYLSHMLFIITLTWAGWGRLSSVIPWPVLCLATVAIVFPSGIALTSVLARTPLAVPLTGRTRVPWRRPRRFSPHPAVLADQD